MPSSTILVVDDHPTNRALLEVQLAALDFECVTAQHGMEGLQALRDGVFAAVLVDYHMPGMNGHEFVLALRAEEAAAGRSRTPVIACTGETRGDVQARCLADGMDDFLLKPIRLADIKTCLAKWVRAGE
jgi:two-component system, NarL family, sensor histidine kinase EvgS